MAKGDTINDGEMLYRFINPKALPQGQDEIPPGIFLDSNLSCDWHKYRNDPYTSFHLNEGKTKIIQINICDEIRNPRNPKREGELVDAWKQDIVHDPINEKEDLIHGANEAHSLISGRKKLPVVDAICHNSIFYN